jgi:Galactose oxidase, central domain/Kelch motif
VIDEIRIERALRQGPPFATGYAQRPLPFGATAQRRGMSLVALVVAAILLVVAVAGASLIGSGGRGLSSLLAGLPTSAPTWVATGNMVNPRDVGSMTLLDDGMVLVAGGADGPGVVQAAAELFDPRTLTWIATGDMGQARTSHTATLLPDGRVLVLGGGTDEYNNGPALRTAEVYDPAGGHWAPVGSMTEARLLHTATMLSDGRVLVAGGMGVSGSLDSAELYDPATNTWTPTGSLAQDRGNHRAILLQDGRVLVVGGVTGGGGGGCCLALSTAEVYDPRTGTWAPAAGMVDLHGGSTATLLLDGRVLVVGEINGELNGNGLAHGVLYDPGTGSWSPTSDMINPLANIADTLLDGRVLFVGGNIYSGPFRYVGWPTAQIYDPETDTWSAAPNMLAVRGEGQQAITLADGRVLVVGGRTSPRTLSNPIAEVYDAGGS